MNAHTMSIVVDLRALGALRRSRVLAPADPADDYVSKRVRIRATPAFDFQADVPPGRNTVH